MPCGVDVAAGVSARWYVAIVNHNSERKCADKIQALGYDTYVAVQSEHRLWRNGRRKVVERVLIPCTVFVRCTEQQRRTLVELPYIFRFMTNKAISSGSRIAVIPAYQIAQLRFMLGQTDTPVTIDGDYRRGDRVRVIRGPLRSLEGQVISDADGQSTLLVRLDYFGCARLTISPTDLEPLP